MKTLTLVSHKDDNYTFVYVDVVDKLPEYDNIIKESIKEYKVFTVNKNDTSKLQSIAKAIPHKINFIMKGNKIYTESRLSRELLAQKCFTCIAIYNNLLGERLGVIISDMQGKLYSVKIEDMVNQMRKWRALTNMFLKNGHILVSIRDIEIPQVYLGTKLKAPKVGKTPEVNAHSLSKFKAPIRAMINRGFKQYCDQFGLYDNYPEETLWFYYELMKNGEIGIIAHMLSKKKFEFEQLVEIARGLRHGVNINVYADPSISVNDMIKARVEQERGTFVEMPMPKRLQEMEEEAKRTNNQKLLKKISLAKETIKKQVNKSKGV